jgi:hypothetical protein
MRERKKETEIESKVEEKKDLIFLDFFPFFTLLHSTWME